MTPAEDARQTYEAACVAYWNARMLNKHTRAHTRRVERAYSDFIKARNVEEARREAA